MAEPFGSRWVSWSRTPDSGGSYMIRPGQRRRDRDDDPASAGHQAATAVHGDAVGGVLDQQHGRLEHDVVGDQGRQSTRDLAGAADEPRGLGAALGLGEELRRHAAGLNGEQQMQEGHLGGGHREDPDGADLQQVAGDDAKAPARHTRRPP